MVDGAQSIRAYSGICLVANALCRALKKLAYLDRVHSAQSLIDGVYRCWKAWFSAEMITPSLNLKLTVFLASRALKSGSGSY